MFNGLGSVVDAGTAGWGRCFDLDDLGDDVSICAPAAGEDRNTALQIHKIETPSPDSPMIRENASAAILGPVGYRSGAGRVVPLWSTEPVARAKTQLL